MFKACAHFHLLHLRGHGPRFCCLASSRYFRSSAGQLADFGLAARPGSKARAGTTHRAGGWIPEPEEPEVDEVFFGLRKSGHDLNGEKPSKTSASDADARVLGSGRSRPAPVRRPGRITDLKGEGTDHAKDWAPEWPEEVLSSASGPAASVPELDITSSSEPASLPPDNTLKRSAKTSPQTDQNPTGLDLPPHFKMPRMNASTLKEVKPASTKSENSKGPGRFSRSRVGALGVYRARAQPEHATGGETVLREPSTVAPTNVAPTSAAPSQLGTVRSRRAADVERAASQPQHTTKGEGENVLREPPPIVTPTSTASNNLRTARPPPAAVESASDRKPTNTIWVGAQLGNLSRAEICEMFEKWGKVTDVHRATRPDGTPKNWAHITFSSLSSAQSLKSAFSAHPDRFARDLGLGPYLDLDYAYGVEKEWWRDPRTVCVREWGGTEGELRDAVGWRGERAVRWEFVERPRYGTHFALLQFPTVDQAQEARDELNGKVYNGWELLVTREGREWERERKGERERLRDRVDWGLRGAKGEREEGEEGERVGGLKEERKRAWEERRERRSVERVMRWEEEAWEEKVRLSGGKKEKERERDSWVPAERKRRPNPESSSSSEAEKEKEGRFREYVSAARGSKGRSGPPRGEESGRWRTGSRKRVVEDDPW